MFTRRFTIVAFTIATLALAPAVVRAGFIGPSSYLSFADSPFNGTPFAYFYLETFEDGVLNMPGVTASTGSVIGPGGLTDSVDGDDGMINGSGGNGRSFFSGSGETGISFTFSAVGLGSLPTHAGIVWTDGLGNITFEAFDQNGLSLGTLVGNHADVSISGTTAEDRLYGVSHMGGISRIHIRNAVGGIEVDHLQYGAESVATVPEPASIVLLGTAIFGLLGYNRLRRRFGGSR